MGWGTLDNGSHCLSFIKMNLFLLVADLIIFIFADWKLEHMLQSSYDIQRGHMKYRAHFLEERFP